MHHCKELAVIKVQARVTQLVQEHWGAIYGLQVCVSSLAGLISSISGCSDRVKLVWSQSASTTPTLPRR